MPSKYVVRSFAENSCYHVFNRGEVTLGVEPRSDPAKRDYYRVEPLDSIRLKMRRSVRMNETNLNPRQRYILNLF